MKTHHQAPLVTLLKLGDTSIKVVTFSIKNKQNNHTKTPIPRPQFSTGLDNKLISLFFSPVRPQIHQSPERRGSSLSSLVQREDCLSNSIQPHLGSLSESNGWHRCHCESNLTCKTLNTGDNVQEGKKPAGARSSGN